jgi:hypothetical protein
MVFMRVIEVELGVPFTGWPLRGGSDYEFGLRDLPSAVVEDLRRWAAEFNREFGEAEGWSSEASRHTHRVEGERLRTVVQELLGNSYNVVLNPLGSGRLR